VPDLWQWVTTHEAEAIGVLIGVVGIILTIFFGAKQVRQEQKVLDWELNTDESIVGTVAAKQVTSELSVRYSGLELERPRIIVMRIINTGWREIIESDLPAPTTLRSQFLAQRRSLVPVLPPCPIARCTPLDQALVKVELKPRSMKRKSWLKLQLIVDGGGRPLVSANFTGQSRPMRELVETAIKRGWIWIYLMMPLILIVGVGEVFLLAHPVWSWVVVVLMAGILSAMLVLRRRIKRAKRR
jgi:hypothetical protein